MPVAAKLKELGLTLPEPPRPVATYVPAVRTGNLLFVSGQLPFVDGKLQKVGKLGGNFTVDEGIAAARTALPALIAEVRSLRAAIACEL